MNPPDSQSSVTGPYTYEEITDLNEEGSSSGADSSPSSQPSHLSTPPFGPSRTPSPSFSETLYARFGTVGDQLTSYHRRMEQLAVAGSLVQIVIQRLQAEEQRLLTARAEFNRQVAEAIKLHKAKREKMKDLAKNWDDEDGPQGGGLGHGSSAS